MSEITPHHLEDMFDRISRLSESQKEIDETGNFTLNDFEKINESSSKELMELITRVSEIPEMIHENTILSRAVNVFKMVPGVRLAFDEIDTKVQVEKNRNSTIKELLDKAEENFNKKAEIIRGIVEQAEESVQRLTIISKEMWKEEQELKTVIESGQEGLSLMKMKQASMELERSMTFNALLIKRRKAIIDLGISTYESISTRMSATIDKYRQDLHDSMAIGIISKGTAEVNMFTQSAQKLSMETTSMLNDGIKDIMTQRSKLDSITEEIAKKNLLLANQLQGTIDQYKKLEAKNIEVMYNNRSNHRLEINLDKGDLS